MNFGIPKLTKAIFQLQQSLANIGEGQNISIIKNTTHRDTSNTRLVWTLKGGCAVPIMRQCEISANTQYCN